MSLTVAFLDTGPACVFVVCKRPFCPSCSAKRILSYPVFKCAAVALLQVLAKDAAVGASDYARLSMTPHANALQGEALAHEAFSEYPFGVVTIDIGRHSE